MPDRKEAENINKLGKDDAEDVAWTVIESLASANDTAAGVVSVLHFLRDTYTTFDEDDPRIIPNPFVLEHGFSGRSPKTVSYLQSRGLKQLGGGALALAGSLSSAVTVVDVAGIAQHGNAVGSTGAHIMGIKAAAKGFKNSRTITRWADAMLKAKYAKLAVRGTDLSAAAIPVPALGLGTGIATTVAKLGIKVTLGKLVARTAMEVHWRARQEVTISRVLPGGGGGKLAVGPASAMFVEIFTRRGATRIFGKYDIEAFLKEPGGWMALNDKLMLV